MFGDIQRVWYHNEKEDRWVKLYLRGIHQLWQGDTLIYPQLGEPQEHTQVSAAGKASVPATYRTIPAIPKRAEVREWLLNPPDPPFTIAIAESGQKHILFLAQEAYSRDLFPVQFEMDSLVIDAGFAELLGHYESLLNMGFSKTELDSGEYRPDRLLANMPAWQAHDPALSRERYGNKPSRLLQLASFVGLKPEYIAPHPKPEKPAKQPQSTPSADQEAPVGQLALF